jgi:cyclic pyranopterin phosphate synthase
MAELTHIDEQGRARMVDVGAKKVTERTAVASARVRTRPDVIAKIREGAVAKGDVLATARIAGIMAAKRTPELIPLCHPLRIDGIDIELELGDTEVRITATVKATDRTGVEMEALTAAAVAALTVYDMCKAVDRAMSIEAVRLEEKTGGKSGRFLRSGEDEAR